MLDYRVMQIKATLKLVPIYGKEYLKRKLPNTCVARCDMGDFMRFYFCFENEDERPDLQADYKGWTVWATLDVDGESGDVKIVECVMPNGERVEG